MSTTYTDWPKKGDTRPQPWENPEESGITPRAGLPSVGPGGADDGVHELLGKLGELGFESPTSRGENPFGTLGVEELAAIRQFRNDFGVREDPTAYGGDSEQARQLAGDQLGPWTGEAIHRAHALKEAGTAEPSPVEQLEKRLAAVERKLERLTSKPKAAKPSPAKKPDNTKATTA